VPRSAAELIREHLPNLTHPGDPQRGPIPLALPMFRNAAIPPDVAREMAAEVGLPEFDIAALVADAIVHLLRENRIAVDYTVDDIEQLQADAHAGTQRRRRVQLTCTCGAPLVEVDVDVDRPRVDGPALIRDLSSRSADCATGHARSA